LSLWLAALASVAFVILSKTHWFVELKLSRTARFHDCDYFRARNALIPEAEKKVASAKVAMVRDDGAGPIAQRFLTSQMTSRIVSKIKTAPAA
jgi:hypothetical protein